MCPGPPGEADSAAVDGFATLCVGHLASVPSRSSARCSPVTLSRRPKNVRPAIAAYERRAALSSKWTPCCGSSSDEEALPTYLTRQSEAGQIWALSSAWQAANQRLHVFKASLLLQAISFGGGMVGMMPDLLQERCGTRSGWLRQPQSCRKKSRLPSTGSMISLPPLLQLVTSMQQQSRPSRFCP